MTTIEVLRQARELISTPDKWTTGALARDAAGEPVLRMSPGEPVSYCMLGALAVTVSNQSPEFRAARRALELASGVGTLIGFNDAPLTTHAKVLAVFDAAIAAAEVSP